MIHLHPHPAAQHKTQRADLFFFWTSWFLLPYCSIYILAKKWLQAGSITTERKERRWGDEIMVTQPLSTPTYQPHTREQGSRTRLRGKEGQRTEQEGLCSVADLVSWMMIMLALVSVQLQLLRRENYRLYPGRNDQITGVKSNGGGRCQCTGTYRKLSNA